MSRIRFRSGKITNSAVAVGPSAQASAGSVEEAVSAQQAVVTAIDRLVSLLEQYQSEVPDAEEVRDSALIVKDELDGEEPNRHAVHWLLKGIAANVVTVATLTDAVEHIRAALAALFS